MEEVVCPWKRNYTPVDRQTEKHVIEHCHRTVALGQQYDITTIENLFMERKDYAHVCYICHAVLSEYL